MWSQFTLEYLNDLLILENKVLFSSRRDMLYGKGIESLAVTMNPSHFHQIFFLVCFILTEARKHARRIIDLPSLSATLLRCEKHCARLDGSYSGLPSPDHFFVTTYD